MSDIESAMVPLVAPPPQIDYVAVWILPNSSQHLEAHFHGWTTNRMLDSVHWWMQANGKVNDRTGEVYFSFDGDHDVICAHARKGYTAVMKFDPRSGIECQWTAEGSIVCPVCAHVCLHRSRNGCGLLLRHRGEKRKVECDLRSHQKSTSNCGPGS